MDELRALAMLLNVERSGEKAALAGRLASFLQEPCDLGESKPMAPPKKKTVAKKGTAAKKGSSSSSKGRGRGGSKGAKKSTVKKPKMAKGSGRMKKAAAGRKSKEAVDDADMPQQASSAPESPQ